MLLMPEVEAGDGVEVMPVANMSTGEAQAATEGSIDVMVDVRGAPDRLAAAGNRRDAGPL